MVFVRYSIELKFNAMFWKVTYIYWCSVVKQTMFVKADTENEAWKIADSQFGYEEVDIKSVEPISEEEILNEVVYGRK